jgi:hypothetical protein
VSRNSRIKLARRASIPFGRDPALRHCLDAIGSELLRSHDFYIDPASDECTHIGWGRPGTDYAAVHFRQSIATTPLILEAAAVRVSPDLKRAPGQTVADYVMGTLREACGLSTVVCERYVAAYERARFTRHEVTFTRYADFQKLFLHLLSSTHGLQHSMT